MLLMYSPPATLGLNTPTPNGWKCICGLAAGEAEVDVEALLALTALAVVVAVVVVT